MHTRSNSKNKKEEETFFSIILKKMNSECKT